MNPLDAKGEDERKDWANTSCCWPNVARLFCLLREYPGCPAE